jgi:hypothetical protein
MDLLSWSQLLGNVGEFIGSIAILITLVYLAVQVRDTKEALSANSRDQRASRALDLFLTAADSDHLVPSIVSDMEKTGSEPRVFVRKLMDRGMSQEDAERLRYYYSALNRHYETLWRNPMSDDEKQSVIRNVLYTFSAGTARDFWETTASQTTGSEYSMFVTQLLAENR